MTIMPTPEPKTMARSLRTALAERDMPISHSTALELVARQFGYADWNVLAARGLWTPETIAAPRDAAAARAGVAPDGWHASGRADLFTYAVHPDAGPDRTAALSIESRAPGEQTPIAGPGEFLTVMQRISAAPYRGGSVSFRALLRCDDAAGFGRIWLHARGAGRETLHSDNLGLAPGPRGPVTGTTDWTRRTVTIFVANEAAYLGFGILFGSGTGRFMAAGLSFGAAEPGETPRDLPDAPRNLGLL